MRIERTIVGVCVSFIFLPAANSLSTLRRSNARIKIVPGTDCRSVEDHRASDFSNTSTSNSGCCVTIERYLE